jgi:hypothetical protein
VQKAKVKAKIPLNLIHAHFFFIDIVGLSDPVISVKRQKKKIETLNNLIASCEVFRNTDNASKIILPTGDGNVIGFKQGPELPLMLAIELHKKLKTYNKGRSPEEILKVRIGLNDGPVYVVKDLEGKENVWGPGIILARRVMDIGEDGHILVSQQTAETLRNLSDEYKLLIKPMHDYTIKHGERMLLYSVYGSGIGNAKMPTTNLYQSSQMSGDLIKRKLSMIDRMINVELIINDPKTVLTHYKRTHVVENISDEPIETLLHGIATDVPKSFADLNIKVTDESGDELKITSINLDTPYQKEFRTLFDKPIQKSEKGRSYTLEYDVEEPERYFENYFTINCKKFVMSLIYPADAGFNPVVYDVNVENETQTKCKTQPRVQEVKNDVIKVTWTKANVLETQAFRLDW